MRLRPLFLLPLLPSPSHGTFNFNSGGFGDSFRGVTDFLEDTGLVDFNDITGSAFNLVAGQRRLMCAAKFLIMEQTTTDPLRFSDKYRDDSVMILSESGDYVGMEDIVEYLGFVYEDTSPFVNVGPVPQVERRIVVGYDRETNQCILHRYNIAAYALNPDLTVQNTVASIALLNALFLDYDEMYLTRIHIFYPKTFLNWYFGEQFNTEPVKNFVCQDVLVERCGAPSFAQCRNQLDALPAATGDAYVDGNSLGCRVLHSAFAIQNPEGHCPHVTLDTTDVDSDGDAKCSVSAGVTPLDLFEAETIADFNLWVAVSFASD